MRRIAVVGVAVALATGLLVPGAGAPVGAQAGLGLTVAPTTGLTDNGVVDIEVSGLPAGEETAVEIRQCDEPVASGATPEELSHCNSLVWSLTGGQPTYTASVRVPETFTVYPLPDMPAEPHSCSDEAFDCSIVAFVAVPEGEPAGEVVSVPVDFTPTPLRIQGMLGDAEPAQAFIALDPGATVTLAQCVDFVDVPRDLENCLAGPTVTLPTSGRGTAEVTLAQTVEVDGVTYDCGLRPCQLVAFDPSGNELATAHVPGSVPSGRITLERTTSIPPGATVHATVESGGFTLLGQCVASVLDGTIGATEGCKLLGYVYPGRSELDVTLEDRFMPATGTQPVACADHPGGCIVAMGDASGATSWYVPIGFGPPPSLTVTPATGLVDGQAMTVDVAGLFPGQAYTLRRCSSPATAGNCEPAVGEFVASDEGEVTATVPAAQQLDAPRRTYCRDNCVVAAVRSSDGVVAAAGGYRMAGGSLAAAPSTGLADGQTVTVTGSGIMASYDGPLFWIVPTGRWTLAECDAGLLDQRTLLGVFTHCGAAVDGPVEVPGSTLSLPVAVAASVERILGGTTDCRAPAGACVVALMRLEFDGSLSLHTTPLSFA
jgi:hypothetical protein